MMVKGFRSGENPILVSHRLKRPSKRAKQQINTIFQGMCLILGGRLYSHSFNVLNPIKPGHFLGSIFSIPHVWQI